MSAFRRLLVAVAVAFAPACGEVDSPGMQAGEIDVGQLQQGATACGKGPTVDGIDVSSWQGTIDWKAVAASGKKYAIARIGDGFYKDPKFAVNWPAIKANGMIRGAYQYFRPDKDPLTQADIVVSAVGKLGASELPVTCDVEAQNPGVTKADYVKALHAWAKRVTGGTGKEPMFYTGFYYWRDFVGTKDFAAHDLWHAQYTSATCPNIADAWTAWTFWQYSSSGRVPGISGNVDMNRFNGTLADLQALAGVVPTPPTNHPPRGALDAVGCEAIVGWAQDPDVPGAAIDVHLYIGGPAGDPKAVSHPVRAGTRRADLCGAIGSCDHGFNFAPPQSLLDGAPRTVYAYGIDSAGGANALLGGSPRTLSCPRPLAPFPPTAGMKRRVPGPEAMAAWKLDRRDLVKLPESALAAYPEGPSLSSAPVLEQKKGDLAVYLVENGTLRHVASPASMEAWRFDWSAIKNLSAAEWDASVPGAALSLKPFWVQDAAGAVWLIDAPVPLWAEVVSDDVPKTLAAGEARKAVFRLKNRGSLRWMPGEILLAASEPREKDSPLCDPSWASCKRAGTVSAVTASGEEGVVETSLRAPSVAGPVRSCFALVYKNVRYFGDKGHGGPGDAALCVTVEVTAPAVENPPRPENPGPVQPEPQRPGPSAGSSAEPSSSGPAGITGACGCGSTEGTTAGIAWAAAFVVPLLRRRRG